MATRSSGPDTTAVVADVEVNETRSYVDWAAVIAGALIATVMSFILTTFGSSLGLAVSTPWSPHGISAETLGIAAAIWFAITHIYSVAMGAYFAGRMRPRVAGIRSDSDEVDFRDGTNGLVVWALSILIMVGLAAAILGGAARLAGHAVGGAADLVGPVAEQANDALWRSAAEGGQQPAPGQPPAEPGAAPPAQPGQPPAAAPPAGGQPAARPPTDAERQEVLRILQRGFARGEIVEEDRKYLAQLVESTTGLDAKQAEERVRTRINEATERAKQITEQARRTASLSSFLGSVVLLLSGIAAWWAASLGGNHRDESRLGDIR